ncbi:MAG TPA: glycoside hydrolase family 36 N-terminal domain-containing protein, partial [Candidatus Limnocylindrales bacterium]|nr:glycoside hydrolase family 36 N-terminal domain-containing protein [Candidatus Limnocylindrales bacterium]
MIDWDGAGRQLHLHNGLVSYVIRVLDDGSLGHLHFGPPLAPGASYAHLAPASGSFGNRLGESIPLESPTVGTGDYRVPAIEARLADGSGVLRLAYAGHEISSGKPVLDGLPATYVEAEDEAATVTVSLADSHAGIEVALAYTIFADRPVVARSMRVRNGGPSPVRLESAMSASLDLPDADWTLVRLSGTWARERHVVSERLTPGRHGVASTRGHSSHEH